MKSGFVFFFSFFFACFWYKVLALRNN